MKFALNYSRPAADLFRRGKIAIDYFKCPNWPEVVDEAAALAPAFVHFPLRVGSGRGDALDDERGRPVDWQEVEDVLARTGTPLVNAHLTVRPEDFPDLAADTMDPIDQDRLVEAAVRDLAALVSRFGTQRVIVENISPSRSLAAILSPRVIRQVIDTAGCGFLLDLSHARLSAAYLGLNARDYLAQLPLSRVREIHITGIQCFDAAWMARLARAGVDGGVFAENAGKWMDHLPLTEPDWEFVEWALQQVRLGAWGNPWVITLEYGGSSALWEALTDREVLQTQVPRLYDLVQRASDGSDRRPS